MAGFKTDISLGSRWVLDFEPNPKLNVIENQRYRNQHKKIFSDSKIFWFMTQTQNLLFLGVKRLFLNQKT